MDFNENYPRLKGQYSLRLIKISRIKILANGEKVSCAVVRIRWEYRDMYALIRFWPVLCDS